MLKFDFDRDRRTGALSCTAVRVTLASYTLRVDFKSDARSTSFAPNIIDAIHKTLVDLPKERGIYLFPDFQASQGSLMLSGGKVHQSTSTLANAHVSFTTSVVSGCIDQIIAPEQPKETIVDQHLQKFVTLLLNASLYLSNVNSLQIDRLGPTLSQSERDVIERQSARLSALADCLTRLHSEGWRQPSGLTERIASLTIQALGDPTHPPVSYSTS